MKIEDIKVGEIYQFTNKVSPDAPEYPNGKVRVEGIEPWPDVAGLHYLEVSYVGGNEVTTYPHNWECQLRELSEIEPPEPKGSPEPIVISKHCYYAEHEMCLHAEICNCDCHKE